MTIPKSGFDLVNNREKIFVEMKNKHNTMNSSSSQKTYITMQHKILEGADITCMLVEVIAKNSQNLPWKISIDGRQFNHENIRRVSIDKFYELVTNDTYAFKKLCEILPIVLDDVIAIQEKEPLQNSVFAELSEIAPKSLLKSLYQLSFKKYNGF